MLCGFKGRRAPLTCFYCTTAPSYALALAPLPSPMIVLAQRLGQHGSPTFPKPLIELFHGIPASMSSAEVQQKVEAALAEWREGEHARHTPLIIPILSDDPLKPSIVCNVTGAPLVQKNPDYVKDWRLPESLSFGVREVGFKAGRTLLHLSWPNSADRLLDALKHAFDPFPPDDHSAEATAWYSLGEFPSLELSKVHSEEEHKRIQEVWKSAEREGAVFGIGSQKEIKVDKLVILKGEGGSWKEVITIQLA